MLLLISPVRIPILENGCTELLSIDGNPSRPLIDIGKRLDDHTGKHVHEDVPDR